MHSSPSRFENTRASTVACVEMRTAGIIDTCK